MCLLNYLLTYFTYAMDFTMKYLKAYDYERMCKL